MGRREGTGKNEKHGCQNGKEEEGVKKGYRGGEGSGEREGMGEGEDRRVWRMEKGEGRREEEGRIGGGGDS